MEYRIIEETSAYNLTLLINEHIARGWLPVGGVAISEREHDTIGKTKIYKSTYAQAITIEGEEEDVK